MGACLRIQMGLLLAWISIRFSSSSYMIELQNSPAGDSIPVYVYGLITSQLRLRLTSIPVNLLL